MGFFETAGRQVSGSIMWIIGAFLVLIWVILIRSNEFLAWSVLVIGILIVMISGFVLRSNKHRDF